AWLLRLRPDRGRHDRGHRRSQGSLPRRHRSGARRPTLRYRAFLLTSRETDDSREPVSNNLNNVTCPCPAARSGSRRRRVPLRPLLGHRDVAPPELIEPGPGAEARLEKGQDGFDERLPRLTFLEGAPDGLAQTEHVVAKKSHVEGVPRLAVTGYEGRARELI